MASSQIKSTPKIPIPEDTELLKWKPRKLKDYITNHGMDASKLTGIDKTRLQFYAMDCATWTKDRLISLHPRFRAMFLEKIPTSIDTETRGIFMDSTDATQRAQTIDKLLTLLPQSDPVESIEAIDQDPNVNASERSVVLNQNASNNEHDPNDDMSSVSTHESMPSLMSDDDSDDEDEETDSDSDPDNDAPLQFDEQKSGVKSIEPPKPQRKKKSKQKDDFLSGLQGAFLTKGKKGKKKDKKKVKKAPKKKTQSKSTIKSVTDKKPSAIKPQKTETVKSNQNQPPPKKQSKSPPNNTETVKSAKKDVNKMENKAERTVDAKPKPKPKQKSGYYLRPNDIKTYKNANGSLFICSSERKLKADLTPYTIMKCFVKRGKKGALYSAVVIDLGKCEDREEVRKTLKRSFENVVSFDMNNNCHVMHVTKDNEKRLSLSEAFAEYEENGVRINDPAIKAKALKAAKQALAASQKKKKKKKKQQAKPITNKPVVLEKKVNVEQRLAKDQMNDIESKLAALSVTDHKKKKNSNKQKRKTEKVEKKEVNDAYSYITTELMNSCRLHPEDIESLMDDESKDEAIRGLYIRAPISGSQYRVLQMEQSKHHNNNHYFLSSYGSTKCNVKLSKISSDDFEQKEINAWIMRMCKDGVTVPSQAILSETAENLTTIREAVALKKKTATLVTDEPGVVAPGTTTAAFTQPLSPPHDVQSPGPGAPAATAPTSHLMSSNTFHHQGALNYKNLAQLNRQPTNQRNFLVSKYTSAIDLGANCFWAIPTAEGDSNYICFLLMKTHRNDDHLTEAKQIAMSVRSDVMVSEIREWTARAGSKSGHWKSKGWFIDCKDSKSAYQISQKLLEFLPKTYGYGKPANFCRQVLKEFGDAYVKPRQKPRKGIKNKPMGPVFNYKDGEPSLISMSECGKPVTFRPGEKDYDAQSEYSMASISNQTVSKYDNISHMIPPRQEVNAVPYRVNDKVQYLGKKYDVVWVNGESIRIENDTESELVKPHEIRHVS
eukprot:467455_1